jgi:hypothetical protein
MDTDTNSGDLVLVLETTNDAASPKVTTHNQQTAENSDIKDKSVDVSNSSEAQTAPPGVNTTPSAPSKENSNTTTPGSKTQTGSKGTPTGPKGTPTGQPRRIQFITLSNGKTS